jgi:hypothetical protein
MCIIKVHETFLKHNVIYLNYIFLNSVNYFSNLTNCFFNRTNNSRSPEHFLNLMILFDYTNIF